MRSLLFAIPASLLLIASGTGAQSQDYPLTTSLQTVEVTPAARSFHVTRDQTDAIKGLYGLSNGWYLKVRPTVDGIIAQIDDQRPMRLNPVARDRYATRDGNVSMEFNLGALGEEMVMSYVPQSRIAGLVTVGATMAAR